MMMEGHLLLCFWDRWNKEHVGMFWRDVTNNADKEGWSERPGVCHMGVLIGLVRGCKTPDKQTDRQIDRSIEGRRRRRSIIHSSIDSFIPRELKWLARWVLSLKKCGVGKGILMDRPDSLFLLSFFFPFF
jgi:hypothetical protein